MDTDDTSNIDAANDEYEFDEETVKTVCASPCMIVFACLSVLEALLVLVAL